ncbi:hypothetical protein [Deinococcus navajonensis]|uniref:Uncharacterized protein n=1 Tax=Deinococcus navajonensis TaxID=309884 RepID=A0ABV8XU01_9DEIO
MDRPTDQPPGHAASGQSPAGSFGEVIERNVGILRDLHQSAEARKSTQDRVAAAITPFTGSMLFVYLHLAPIGG